MTLAGGNIAPRGNSVCRRCGKSTFATSHPPPTAQASTRDRQQHNSTTTLRWPGFGFRKSSERKPVVMLSAVGLTFGIHPLFLFSDWGQGSERAPRPLQGRHPRLRLQAAVDFRGPPPEAQARTSLQGFKAATNQHVYSHRFSRNARWGGCAEMDWCDGMACDDLEYCCDR